MGIFAVSQDRVAHELHREPFGEFRVSADSPPVTCSPSQSAIARS